MVVLPGCAEDTRSLKKNPIWSSHGGSAVVNPISIHEDMGLIPGPIQWVKDLTLWQAVV